MSRLSMTALSISLLVSPAYAFDGLIAYPSNHSTQSTMDKLESIAKTRNLKVFARIDHAAGAQSINQPLRPTQLLIFGNPKGGTPLLQCDQTWGIDLPMRVLAWEDDQGKNWLGYTDPAVLARKHQDPVCDVVFKRLTVSLDELVREAIKD